MTLRQMIDWFRRDVTFTFRVCRDGIAKDAGCNGFLTTPQHLSHQVVARLKEFCVTKPQFVEEQTIRIPTMTTRQVTPEEEIADLKAFLDGIKQFPDDDTFRYETDRGGVLAILAAIRAAENDALERSGIKRMVEKLERIAVNFWLMEMSADARSIESLLDETSPGSRDKIGDELQRIRALKHKDTT